jgi:hypothetical protein
MCTPTTCLAVVLADSHATAQQDPLLMMEARKEWQKPEDLHVWIIWSATCGSAWLAGV